MSTDSTAIAATMIGRQIAQPSVLTRVRAPLERRYTRFSFELLPESQFVFEDRMRYAVLQSRVGYVELFKQHSIAAVKRMLGADVVKPLVHVSRCNCLNVMFDPAVMVTEYGTPCRYDGVRQVHKL